MPAPRQIESHAALRGVAALLVVAYHLQYGGGYRLALERASNAFTRSYLFVDLFFILSGFIISYVYYPTQSKAAGAGETSAFLWARVRRLYPLHLFCLCYLILFRLLTSVALFARHKTVDYWQPQSLESLGSQLVLLNAWFPKHPGWNIPSWSISAEFFAYALFPIVVLIHARARMSCEIILACIALLFFGYILGTSGSLDIVVGLAPLRCIAGFFLGMLLYLHRDLPGRLADSTLSVIQTLSIGAILVVLTMPIADPWIIPPFFLLVASTWTDRGILPVLLRRRPLLWLGEISYSVYLNHVCLIEILAFLWGRSVQHLWGVGPFDRCLWIATVYAATLFVSYLTFRYVEVPARAWLTRRWQDRKAAPIGRSPPAP